MTSLELNRFEVLTFDCYGTLIDWEQGIVNALRAWTDGLGVSLDDRTLLEAFARAEPVVEHEHPTLPYRDLLRVVHGRLADELGLASTETDRARFAGSVGTWPPFPDTVSALRILARRYPLVILSNVDAPSFAESKKLLGVEFAAVVTAEDVGAYKPDLRMFERMLEVVTGMGHARDRVLHVAQSLYHDHAPAHEIGLSTVWVNRRGPASEGWGATPPPAADVHPDFEVPDLAALATMVET